MLVDDHAVVRAGYRLLLSQTEDVRVVCEAACGEEACQLYLELRPQVVVMDLSLPGIGGLAAVRRLVCHDPASRILMFSIHDEPVYVVRALESGAKGYITKSCAPEILVDAVRRIARGQTYLEQDIALRMPVPSVAKAEADSVLSSLSAREFDVFCLLARGFTTREVAERLHLGYKTVANYATLIKSKLSVNTTAEMARLAYQYRLIPD